MVKLIQYASKDQRRRVMHAMEGLMSIHMPLSSIWGPFYGDPLISMGPIVCK